MRSQLPEGGSFVVKAGHVVTRVGVQLYAADSEQAGMLARQQEIENLDAPGARAGVARRRSEGRRDPRRSGAHASRAGADRRAPAGRARDPARARVADGCAQAHAGARALHAAQHADSRGTRGDRRADRRAARDACGIGSELRAARRRTRRIAGAFRRSSTGLRSARRNAHGRPRPGARPRPRRHRRALRRAQHGEPHRRTEAQHPGRSRAERACRGVAGRRARRAGNDQRSRPRTPGCRTRSTSVRSRKKRCTPRASNSTI